MWPCADACEGLVPSRFSVQATQGQPHTPKRRVPEDVRETSPNLSR
jgi:hypothetical protein